MALPQAGQGNNGAIHLSIQRGKGLAGDKKGKLEDAFQISWACKVSLHATCFKNTNETQADVEGFFPELRKWFFIEKTEKDAAREPHTMPTNAFLKMAVTMEEYVQGQTIRHDAYSGMAMLSPDLSKRRTTCFLANDTVALRIWSKQPGKWYLVGIRIAVPDASRGKVLGRKVLSNAEKKAIREGETVKREPTPPTYEEAEEGEETFIGKNIKPEKDQRVKFCRQMNRPTDSEHWAAAEGGPGIILEVCGADEKLGILAGDYCRVLFEKTGFRESYPTGWNDEYHLVLHEVDDDGVQKGRKMTHVQEMQKKKKQLETEKEERFKERYGDDGRVGMSKGVKGVAHLMGNDNWKPSKKSKMKPIDFLKMCFALPLVKNQYPHVPTPLLQDPYADPYTHPGSPRPNYETPSKLGLKTPTVAIIGSGVAAAVVARKLSLLNYKITCFEKRNCQGGRLGNVRRGELVLSLGCPFFQASSSAFMNEVEDWCEKGLAVPFDMNVGVLHGQCLGEISHFDSIIPNPELYEKAKKMPAVVAAKRNIADTSGQVVGVRYGRFTICRVWYDCGSELWALEVKHDEINKEVTACEAARDRALGDLRRVEYLLELYQSGNLDFLDRKFKTAMKFLQDRSSWKKTARKIDYLQHEIERFHLDEKALIRYADPKERELARVRLERQRAEERKRVTRELGEELPDILVGGSQSRLKVDESSSRDFPSRDTIGDQQLQLPRKGNISQLIGHDAAEEIAADHREVLQGFEKELGDSKSTEEMKVHEDGQAAKVLVGARANLMTYDEVLHLFMPDMEACAKWTLHQDIIGVEDKTEWILVLREYAAVYSAFMKSENDLEIWKARLESSVQAIEYMKTHSASPEPGQVVDVIIDLCYNKDLKAGDVITLKLPYFKLNDHPAVRKKTVETRGESKETFRSATFYAKTNDLVIKHEHEQPVIAGDSIRLRVPRLVSVPKRGISRQDSYKFNVRCEAAAGSSMVHAMASALVDVPKKPSHIQLHKRFKAGMIAEGVVGGEGEAIGPEGRRLKAEHVAQIEAKIGTKIDIDTGSPPNLEMRDSAQQIETTETARRGKVGGWSRLKTQIEEAGIQREPWATCLYDDEFLSMGAPELDDGLPRHRTAHVHNFDSGLGANQIMYMPTAKSANLCEHLAPGVKYVYNHAVVSILETEGRYRIIAQKDQEEREVTAQNQGTGADVYRVKTAGSSRGHTAGSGYSEAQYTDRDDSAHERSKSPPRLSTAIAKRRLRSMGDFDIVLVCTPPAVAATLTAQIAPQMSAACRNANLEPCWVAYVRIEPVLALANDAFAILQDPEKILIWATRETSREEKASKGLKKFDDFRAMNMLLKGGRPSTAVADSRAREDSWVLHASATWTQNNITTPPEDVAEILAEHFVKLLNLDYEMDIVDSYAYLWKEGKYNDFGPYVDSALPEAKSIEANFLKADLNGGWGRTGIDGALFDAAKGVGVAGDWLVEGTVEGAFLSGAALAQRLIEAHASYVPADFSLAPNKNMTDAGVDHSDRWGYGDWPELDVDANHQQFRWNGRPVTKRATRLMFQPPNPFAGVPLGRPLTRNVCEDPDANFHNWIEGKGILPDSRPPSTHYGEGYMPIDREGRRIMPSDHFDFLDVQSRPTTQVHMDDAGYPHSNQGRAPPSPKTGAPAPPLRPLTRGLLKSSRSNIASPTVRNLSVKFVREDELVLSRTQKMGASYDRLDLEQSSPGKDAGIPGAIAAMAQRQGAFKIKPRKSRDTSPARTAESHETAFGDDWRDWSSKGANPLNSGHEEELKRNADLRREDEKREQRMQQMAKEKEAARQRAGPGDTVDFLAREVGQANPILHRGLPTPLLLYGRTPNPEHLPGSDFRRHTKIRERVNNADRLEDFVNERFDYSMAAETLDERLKRKAKEGRRSGHR